MRILALIAALVASPALGLDLSLPGAQVVKVDTTDAGSTRLPDGPWSRETTVAATEGAIRRTVLMLPTSSLTSLQILEPLREQLLEDGYTQTFACADAECGGFDFRFQLDLLGEPEMHVDLGNYRYVLMQKPGAAPHSVAIVTSPSIDAGFAHITEVSNAVFPEPLEETTTPEQLPTTAPTELIDQLVDRGRAVLSDLEFGTGSVDLGPGPFAVLEELAAWLATNPSARIVLVGHTDAVGSLDANTSLSRRRAGAVANRLVEAFGTDPNQLQAAGAGYLAPLASNLTEEGRAANRRVEVVLLSLN